MDVYWTQAFVFSVEKAAVIVGGSVERGMEVWVGCPATKMVATVLGISCWACSVEHGICSGWSCCDSYADKVDGGLVGLYYAFDYMKDTVIEIYKEIKKVKSGTCNVACKKEADREELSDAWDDCRSAFTWCAW